MFVSDSCSALRLASSCLGARGSALVCTNTQSSNIPDTFRWSPRHPRCNPHTRTCMLAIAAVVLWFPPPTPPTYNHVQPILPCPKVYGNMASPTPFMRQLSQSGVILNRHYVYKVVSLGFSGHSS